MREGFVTAVSENPMRIAIAFYMQETSSFSPVRTTLDTFKLRGLYEGDEIMEKCYSGHLQGFMDAAKESTVDWTPLPIIYGSGGASGPITADALSYFEEKITAGLKAIQPIDAMYFCLHGAGEAENAPDSEGYLLNKVREIIGDEIPLVISLDHHANVTQLMIDKVDGLVAHRTQPHDLYDTGREVGRMLFSTLQGKIKPTMAWKKIPLITHQEQYLTSKGPMKIWFDLAREMETRPGVVSASTTPMQPWLDVPEGGWAAMVVTDNDLPLAQRLAEELADKAWELREDFWKLDSIPVAEAVKRAVKADRGLVVLSDTGDSVYGGATGDSNCILKEMLTQQITEPALVPMVDAEVVKQAIKAGVGETITVMIGGKLDSNFCQPVEITAKVSRIGGGVITQTPRSPDAGKKAANEAMALSFDMGRAVLLEVGSIKIVVSEECGIGGNHPIVYEHFGLNPGDAKMVVVKTASNWQCFQEYISEVIRANTPGATMSNLNQFNWKNLPRPIYPFDEFPR